MKSMQAASINNELGCGIGLWNCNNKKKPGGYHSDATTLKRLKLIHIIAKHMTLKEYY